MNIILAALGFGLIFGNGLLSYSKWRTRQFKLLPSSPLPSQPPSSNFR